MTCSLLESKQRRIQNVQSSAIIPCCVPTVATSPRYRGLHSDGHRFIKFATIFDVRDAFRDRRVVVSIHGRSGSVFGCRSSYADAGGRQSRCRRRRRELEMSAVVRSQQRRTTRVVLPEVCHVKVRPTRDVTAFLAHVDLVATLLVREVELATVHFAAVRLERASLCEGFVALIATIRTYTCSTNDKHLCWLRRASNRLHVT
jgi:hypothetical protein